MRSVSVVIPCHNSSDYLLRALCSVRDQSFAAIEIIIVLDRCSDGSRLIADSFGGCRIIETDFGNGGLARNAGVEQACGDWVAFLDADDWWFSGHLSNLSQVVGDNSGVVGYLNAYVRYINAGDCLGLIKLSHDDSAVMQRVSADLYLEHYARVGFFMGMSACAVQAKRFREIGGFSADMVRRHDIEMWLRLIAGHHWSWDPRGSSAYQVDTPGSLSSNMAQREWFAYRAWERNLKLWGIENDSYFLQLSKAARRAVMAAITDGDALDRAQVTSAVEWLRGRERYVAELGLRYPKTVGFLNRIRRSWKLN